MSIDATALKPNTRGDDLTPPNLHKCNPSLPGMALSSRSAVEIHQQQQHPHPQTTSKTQFGVAARRSTYLDLSSSPLGRIQ